MLGSARSLNDLGRPFGATLSEAEVRHLVDNEWAHTADDIIWRRSKLGLRLSREQIGALDDWMRLNAPQAALATDRKIGHASSRPL
jgi:glycerol-3-phosphate dehydrogenase